MGPDPAGAPHHCPPQSAGAGGRQQTGSQTDTHLPVPPIRPHSTERLCSLVQSGGSQLMVRLVDGGRAARLHGRPPISRINGPPTVGLRAQRRLPEAQAQREAASPPPAGCGRKDWTTSPIYRSRDQGSEALRSCPAPWRTLLSSAGVTALPAVMTQRPHCWREWAGRAGVPKTPEGRTPAHWASWDESKTALGLSGASRCSWLGSHEAEPNSRAAGSSGRHPQHLCPRPTGTSGPCGPGPPPSSHIVGRSPLLLADRR